MGGGVAGGDTLTITVKNQDGDVIETANFGDVITIELTTSITTPTEHRFFINNQTFIQPSNTLNYALTTGDDLIIYAEAENGVAVAAALDAAIIAVSGDQNASAFIAKHELDSAVSMAAIQQNALLNSVRILKGNGSTHGNDLFAQFESEGAVVYPFVPSSNTAASWAGYSVNLIDPTNNATPHGLVPIDAAVTGGIGGIAKHLDLGVAATDFPLDGFGVHYYSRTDSVDDNTIAIGATNTNISGDNTSIFPNYDGRMVVRINHQHYRFVAMPNGYGLFSIIRISSTLIKIYRNGVLLDTITQAVTGASDVNISAFGLNSPTGVLFPDGLREYAGFAVTGIMTDNQVADFFDFWDYLQTNIITNGRNV